MIYTSHHHSSVNFTKIMHGAQKKQNRFAKILHAPRMLTPMKRLTILRRGQVRPHKKEWTNARNAVVYRDSTSMGLFIGIRNNDSANVYLQLRKSV